jgi:hypothetical protein
MAKNKSWEYQQLRRWWETPIGQQVLVTELHKLTEFLPRLFGFHLLLLGLSAQASLVDSSVVLNKTLLNEYEGDSALSSTIKGGWAELPILTDTVEICLLPHILEICDDPDQLMNEMQRILVPEGHLLVMGFSPYSLWGLKRFFKSRQDNFPWNAAFQSRTSICVQLRRLGFKIVESHRYLYEYPGRKPSSITRLFSKCLPFAAGGYLIHAQKKVLSTTPLKASWAKQYAKMKVPGVAAPSQRVSEEK